MDIDRILVKTVKMTKILIIVLFAGITLSPFVFAGGYVMDTIEENNDETATSSIELKSMSGDERVGINQYVQYDELSKNDKEIVDKAIDGDDVHVETQNASKVFNESENVGIGKDDKTFILNVYVDDPENDSIGFLIILTSMVTIMVSFIIFAVLVHVLMLFGLMKEDRNGELKLNI